MKILKITIADIISIETTGNISALEIIGVCELLRVQNISGCLSNNKKAKEQTPESEITNIENLPGKD